MCLIWRNELEKASTFHDKNFHNMILNYIIFMHFTL